mmetsp:Transcript_77167/g.221778  ORF Transcript_77167/g.221778 Transcript_77167/m.221778 type:complete len:231 (-) Transcript_77167:1826-2518(-)
MIPRSSICLGVSSSSMTGAPHPRAPSIQLRLVFRTELPLFSSSRPSKYAFRMVCRPSFNRLLLEPFFNISLSRIGVVRCRFFGSCTRSVLRWCSFGWLSSTSFTSPRLSWGTTLVLSTRIFSFTHAWPCFFIGELITFSTFASNSKATLCSRFTMSGCSSRKSWKSVREIHQISQTEAARYSHSMLTRRSALTNSNSAPAVSTPIMTCRISPVGLSCSLTHISSVPRPRK